MNYDDYRNEYQNIILKESLKREISIKEKFIETIRNSDNQNMLELFLQTNDFKGQILSDKLMLQDLGDNEDFKELIEKDIETTKELKLTAEQRLKELKEQDKEGKEKSENDKHDEHYGKAHNSEQNSSLINKDMENNFSDMQLEYIPRNRFQTYGTQDYYVSNIKFGVTRIISNLQRMKMNVDMCPSPMILAYLSGEREFFDSVQALGRNIQKMPGCDEQLRMLADEQIEAAQEVKDTVDKYIEQYKQRVEENSKNKDNEKNSLEKMEKMLQPEDGKRVNVNKESTQQQENHEIKQREEKLDKSSPKLEQDDSTPRKSWELSPKQKENVQIGTQQVVREYMERQNNPKPVKEQPTPKISSGFDRY